MNDVQFRRNDVEKILKSRKSIFSETAWLWLKEGNNGLRTILNSVYDDKEYEDCIKNKIYTEKEATELAYINEAMDREIRVFNYYRLYNLNDEKASKLNFYIEDEDGTQFRNINITRDDKKITVKIMVSCLCAGDYNYNTPQLCCGLDINDDKKNKKMKQMCKEKYGDDYEDPCAVWDENEPGYATLRIPLTEKTTDKEIDDNIAAFLQKYLYDLKNELLSLA